MTGHEYYNRMETADGFVIEKDPDDLTWYYSILNGEGKFISSGIPVIYPAPASLSIPPHLREHLPQSRNLHTLPAQQDGTLYPSYERSSTSLFRPIVFLIDFSSLPADLNNISSRYSQNQFQSLMFDTNLNAHSAGLPADYKRSMRDYYYEVSNGKLEIHGEVIDWTTLPQSYSYYVDTAQGTGAGSHGIQRSAAAVMVAAALANDAQVDFSEFDGNEDGVVDAVILVVRGWSDGSDTQFWPHMSLLHSGANGIAAVAPNAPVDAEGFFALDNTTIKKYVLVTEQYYQNNQGGAERGWIHPIGTLCHELGHVFGLPDLYDTSPASTEGIGEWGLMGSGNWNMQHSPAYLSAWSRYKMGIIEPQILENCTSLGVSLAPANHHTAYLLPMDSYNPNEYLLLENRQSLGTDLFLKETGLLVWHIDETLTDQYPAMNQVNSNPAFYGVQLLQADGLNELAYTNGHADSGDPYPGSSGNRLLSDQSSPAALKNSYDKNGDSEINKGGESSIIISDITEESNQHIACVISNPNTFGTTFGFDEGDYEGIAYHDNISNLQWAGIRFQPEDTLLAGFVETVLPPSVWGWEVTDFTVNLWKGWENLTPQTLLHSFTVEPAWDAESERDGGWVMQSIVDSNLILLPQYEYFVEINFNGSGGVYPFERGIYSSTNTGGSSYFRGNTEEPCLPLSAITQGDWNIRLVGSQILCSQEGVGECVASCGGEGIIDHCGVCNGNGTSCECPGYPESACDCEGNVFDCQRVCGGAAVIDVCGICGGDGSTCLSMNDGEIPLKFALFQNYPNPFNPVTTIQFALPHYSHLSLRILDIQGREIDSIFRGYEFPGYHSLKWIPEREASGLYFLEMIVEDTKEYKGYRSMKKLLYIR